MMGTITVGSAVFVRLDWFWKKGRIICGDANAGSGGGDQGSRSGANSLVPNGSGDLAVVITAEGGGLDTLKVFGSWLVWPGASGMVTAIVELGVGRIGIGSKRRGTGPTTRR